MNRENLQTLRGLLAEVPDRAFTMNTWGHGLLRGDNPEGSRCGSSGCLACWAIVAQHGAARIEDGFFALGPDFHIQYEYDSPRNPQSVIREATGWLGLEGRECDLFYRTMWPEPIDQLAHDASEHDAALALLDGLLDGTIRIYNFGGIEMVDPE